MDVVVVDVTEGIRRSDRGSVQEAEMYSKGKMPKCILNYTESGIHVLILETCAELCMHTKIELIHNVISVPKLFIVMLQVQLQH